MSEFYVLAKGDARLNILSELLHERGSVLLENAELISEEYKIIYVFAPNYVLKTDALEKIRSGSTVYCGKADKGICEVAQKNAINVFEFLKDDKFALSNSDFTAEATLQILLGIIDRQLREYKIAVVGYGKCGKAISKYLYDLRAKFEIVTSSPTDASILANAVTYKECDYRKYDIILNTAPAKILTDEQLSKLKKKTIIMDISSSPYGLNHERARELGLNSFVYPALPSKLRARACAELMLENILKSQGESYE